MNVKKFKDPIYGYIEIDKDTVHNVIDTATFQRLRNIRQTSYEPLYPAALHNRFVHSLGVYYLGQIAFEALRKSAVEHKVRGTKILKELGPEKWDRYQFLFELACLLHDVGHSPFSHTGEEFYSSSKSSKEIHVDTEEYENRLSHAKSDAERKDIQKELEAAKEYSCRKHLAQLTNDAVFRSAAGENPAPHEIMSCIVALEAFPQMFHDEEERSFFSRCITGLQYEDGLRKPLEKYYELDQKAIAAARKRMLENCFIQLLHSSVIDVDRLDYIIRDASTMGYQSVSVDYKRLLSGIVLVMEDEYNFTVGFHKNAISVIENAVYAHDNEKKWVQSHPAILYDSFLLHRAIVEIEDRIKTEFTDAQSTLFSYDSLTDAGSAFGEHMRVRYLCDADLIHLMKNVYRTPYSDEYFSRNTRRHPIWKSEAEFRNIFKETERAIIDEAMKWILLGDGKMQESMEISRSTIEKLDTEIKEVSDTYPVKQDLLKAKKKYYSAMLDVCKKHGIKEDIVLLSTAFFKSNFSKGKVQKLPIVFPNYDSASQLEDVSATLSSQASTDEKACYYLFCFPKEGEEGVNVKNFAQDLLDALRRCK